MIVRRRLIRRVGSDRGGGGEMKKNANEARWLSLHIISFALDVDSQCACMLLCSKKGVELYKENLDEKKT